MNESKKIDNAKHQETPSTILGITKRSLQFALGLIPSIAIALFNKDTIIKMYSTNVLLSLLVSANLIFVLILAWKWFLFVDREPDLLSQHILECLTRSQFLLCILTLFFLDSSIVSS